MNELHAPTPSSTRATIRPVGDVAVANTTAPRTAIAAHTRRHALGPKRSIAIPSGNWTAAKAKKNELDNRPISTAERSSSRARSGAITPIEFRRN